MTASPPGTRRAHPRACGENGGDDGGDLIPNGSSPRVRGKLVAAHRVRAVRGLIPARAGKTPWLGLRVSVSAAHPRACGENLTFVVRPRGREGSSPRVRGKRRCGWPTGWGPRLIPARAGKTNGARGWSGGDWAHPRACGENRSTSHLPNVLGGSSPRVRGKRPLCLRPILRFGLIPARAGKTRAARCDRPRHWAHPRACGENIPGTTTTGNHAGSSPRVRGKPAVGAAHPDVDGLIPARAGKTSQARSSGVRAAAHPRACGENWCAPVCGIG